MIRQMKGVAMVQMMIVVVVVVAAVEVRCSRWVYAHRLIPML